MVVFSWTLFAATWSTLLLIMMPPPLPNNQLLHWKTLHIM